MIDSSKKLSIFLPAMHCGGFQRAMLKLAKGIAARSYAVDIVLACAEGPFLDEVPESVRIVDLKSHRVLTSLPALIRYLRREKPTAMLSGIHCNIVALCARRLSGVSTRVIVSERNTLSREVQHFRYDLRMRIMPQLIKYFYPSADCIVAVSKGVANDLACIEKIPKERLRVIYNPIVTLDMWEKMHAPLNHTWFKPGEPPVILAVGRLSAQKDFSTLIKAFAKVRRTHPVRLLILGEGEERPKLEELIKRNGLRKDVKLQGFEQNPYPYMARASLFVLSSRWEGLPGVLIEALYCGLPIVATDCPSGPREILVDGQYGKLVKVGDTKALAREIEATLNTTKTIPPRESWAPFEMEFIVNEYIKVLFGN